LNLEKKREKLPPAAQDNILKNVFLRIFLKLFVSDHVQLVLHSMILTRRCMGKSWGSKFEKGKKVWKVIDREVMRG